MDLSVNRVSDIDALSGLKSLTELELWGNDISDVRVLGELGALFYIGLADNQISQQYVDELKILLPSCHIVY